MNKKLTPTFHIIGNSFKLFFSRKYVLIFLGLSFSSVIINLLLANLFNLIFGLSGAIQSSLILFLILIIAAFLYVFFSSLLISFTYNLSNDISLAYPLSFKGLLTRSIKSIFRLILTNILLGLITLGGTILLIIPGIIWGVRFSFAPLISVLEGKKAKEALSESKTMTKGYFWGIITRLAIFGIVVLIPVFIAQFIYPQATSIVSSLFLPLSTLFLVNLYKDLKEGSPLI